MTPADIRAGLLLTEGLGAAARLAVESRVSERVYIDLARALYRKLAGDPKSGPTRASHGAWDPLLAALRTLPHAADELEISRATLNRWIAGTTEPDERARKRIARVARKLGVADPYGG